MSDFDLNHSFGFVLHDTARLISKRYDQRAKGLGLTRAQTRLLAYLLYHEGINQARLADLLEIEPISLARLLDRMEQAGWVERRPDPKDRRAWLLYTTAKLKPVFTKMVEIGKEVRAEALAGLSADEREQVMELLLRVRGNLSDKGREERNEPVRALAGAAE
jgi:MarR family transcriptional regulator, transcriptional regulator for hemolysin